MKTDVGPLTAKSIIVYYEDGTRLILKNVDNNLGSLINAFISQKGVEWRIDEAKKGNKFLDKITEFFRL